MQSGYFLSALHEPSMFRQDTKNEKNNISVFQKNQSLPSWILTDLPPVIRLHTSCSLIFLTLFLLFFTQNSLANDIYATTDSGVRVLLKDDSSWEYIDQTLDNSVQQDLTKVDLKVMGKWTKGNSCRIGLSLMNRKADFIRNLGLEFTAYVANNIPFDSVIIGFYGIKPTRHQYREAIYHGIKCHEINHILVHGGDHCSVGEAMVKFSTYEGECLQAINVIKSDLINIHK